MNVQLDVPVRAAATSTTKLSFILVTSLFFMWGFSHGLLDVLNKHFQDTLNVSKAQSGFLQAAYFGAYFIVALPVGAFMDRYGYKSGILIGLALFALGALLFIPATSAGTFVAFLGALFILACGLGCLETAANLYAAVLGKPETAERRLNFAQSFNGLGVFIGPLIGGSLFFAPPVALVGFALDPVMLTYATLGLVVIAMMAVFACVQLPEVQSVEMPNARSTDARPLWAHSNFTGALVAQFFYMAAQVGIGAFFINYSLEHWSSLTTPHASYLLSIGMLSFMVGRFISTWMMRHISVTTMLVSYALINMVLCAVVIAGYEKISVYALIGTFFFMSILYPSIFAMGVKGLGSKTKRAGAYLVMTLVGGAVAPYIMGGIADSYGTAAAFFVPLVAFGVVGVYGIQQRLIR